MNHDNIYGEVISSHELLNIKFPKASWIVDELIPSEGITILGGKSGEYKSWLSLAIVKSVTNGESLFGKFPCKKRKVLVLDAENHPREVQKRLALLGYTEDCEEFYFSSQPDMRINKGEDAFEDDLTQELIELWAHNGVEVVILDSLTRFHKSEENDAGAMAEVFEKLKELIMAGMSIIILHHTKKNALGSEKDSLRGSSDIMAAIDSYIHIGKKNGEKNMVRVSNPKARYLEEADPFDLQIISDANSFHFEHKGSKIPASEKLRNDIIELLSKEKDGLNKGDIRKVLDSAEKSTKRIIDDLVDDEILKETRGRGSEKIYTKL